MRPHRVSGFAPVLLALLCAGTLSAVAQIAENAPAVHAVRLERRHADALRIDGLLAEEAWRLAQPASGFRQREPLEGEPATERTEVKILFDDRQVYVGVMAYDIAPEKVIARILQRDKVMAKNMFDGKPIFSGDDAVAILFDPFHDHRNAVVFATNPNGAEFDALISDEGLDFNVDWRGIWRVAARRIPGGWSAEFAVPFRSLRYPAGTDGQQPWGFNIYRVIRHKNEEVLWSAWSRDNEGFTRVSKAGHLHGMRDLPRPGLNLEVKPFGLTGGTQDVEAAGARISDRKLETGLDAKWEVRPGLLLDVTLKTDFAQVEVDDEQVNLTRFDLFFPEKRDFFLENAGIFEFGFRGFGEPPPFLMFFSRRIGISDDGEIPVLGGARLTGRVGRQTIGLLNITTNARYGEPRTNFAVARVKRDIGGNGYLGFMATDRRSARSASSAAGVDFSYWPASALNFKGFVTRTVRSGAADDFVYGAKVDLTRSTWGYFGQYLMVGTRAEAETGFITRTDIRRTDQYLRVTPRPGILGIRLVNIFFGGQHITRVDGELQDWNVGPFVQAEWDTGESLSLFYSRGFSRLDDAFDLADSVTVHAADYDLDFAGGFFNTSRNRPFVFNANVFYQKIFGGMMSTVSGRADVAVNSHLALQLGYTHNRVDLPGGAFTADIGSLRLSYAFSTRLFLNGLLQYNRFENSLSTNLRFNYIHSPGSDLFLVVNDGRGTHESVWSLQNRGILLKLTYLKRL